jgi:uncharacterized protein involved in cysteine biosynthesis
MRCGSRSLRSSTTAPDSAGAAGLCVRAGDKFFVFLSLNGYPFGREYFEVVALRRFDRTAARAARHRFAGRVFLGGFAVPLVNLVAPVIATAFMVHLFEGLRRTHPHLLAS